MHVSLHGLTLLVVFAVTLNVRLLPGVAGVPSFTIPEPIIYISFALYLGQAIIPGRDIAGRLKAVFRKNPYIVLYVSWAALAAIVGLSRSTQTLQAFKDLFPCLLVYLMITLTTTSFTQLSRLFFVYCTGLFFNAVLALLQLLTGALYFTPLSENVDAKIDAAGQTVTRYAVGFFNHPNGLAVMMIPLAIYLFAAAIGKIRRPPFLSLGFLATVLPLVFLVLFHTQAKGAWIWVFVGIVWLFFPRRASSWVRLCVAFATLLLVILGLTSYSLGLLGQDPEVLQSVLARVRLWTAAISVLLDDSFVQWFGNGFAAMQDASTAIAYMEYTNAHNTLLNQAIFYGIPASLLYLHVAARSLFYLSRTITLAPAPISDFSALVFVSLLSLFGEYFFEPMAEGVVFQSQLFLLVALADILSDRRMTMENS